MTSKLDHLFGLGDLRACPVVAVQIVTASRLAIMFAHAGRDPLPDLAVRLRSIRAAQGIDRLVRSIDKMWPEPFAIYRPCCPKLSPDEALLAEVVSAAARGHRDSAVAAMRDLLPSISRDRLFREAVEVVDALRTVDATSS